MVRPPIRSSTEIHMNKLLLASAAILGLALSSPAFAEHGDHHSHGGDNAAAPSAPPAGGGGGHHDNGGGGGRHDNGGSGGHHDGANAFAGGGGNAFAGGGDHGWHQHENNGGGGGGNAFAGGGGERHHDRGDNGGSNWHGDGRADNNGWNRDNGGSRWNGGDRNGGGDHSGGDWRGRHGDGFGRAFNAPNRFHWGSYRRPYGWYDQRWEIGAILPGLFWDRQYWIDDYSEFDLGDPPEGAVWVRYGNDALLIDEDSGEVIQVARGIFY